MLVVFGGLSISGGLHTKLGRQCPILDARPSTVQRVKCQNQESVSAWGMVTLVMIYTVMANTNQSIDVITI